ncbi:Putative peptidoglycan binding domain-containing protein, partial [Streptomyces sp. DfronAA-171]
RARRTPPAPPTAPALPRQRDSALPTCAPCRPGVWSLGFFRQQPTGFFGDVTAQALAAFQRDRGLGASGVLDAATWARLRAAGPAPTKAALYPETTLPPTRPDPRCLTGRALCVSKKSRTLAWMVDGRVVSVMDVRFGSAYTPTRDGTFKVYWKSRDHVSTIYHTPMPYALFFSGGQAVHYSPDFAARGYAGASHGCVNVRDKAKVAALFDTVRTGDKVIVY